MSNEIELISEGDSLAVIGASTEVESFLRSLQLTAKELPLERLKRGAIIGLSAAAQAPEILATSGRWVKLTEESARKVKEFGLIDTKVPGVKHAVLGKPGQIEGWIQIVSTPSKMIANPAIISGVAGVMAQSSLQASLKEITDYLERIEEKLDDVIRTQTNAVLARVDGVRFAVNEANAIKNAVGKVSDVTWSKIQNSTNALFETESFAIRQINDEMQRISLESPIADLYQAIKSVETNIPMWLSILANCSSLYDSVAILELDRIMDSTPEDLDNHRMGLHAARFSRLEAISSTLRNMLSRVSKSVERANEKVLFNPLQTPKTIESCRNVAIAIIEVFSVFGISMEEQTTEARRWVDAASERIDATRKVTADTAVAVQNLSKEAASTAKLLKGKVSEKLAERMRRPADDE
jgi:hypothetical protein